MAIGTILLSTLGAIASLASYFVLPSISNAVADLKNSKKGVTEVDIANLISNLYNQVSNKGSKAITDLNVRINSLPIISSSGIVKDMIQKKRRELTKNLTDVETKMNQVSTEAQGIERRANALSMMSDSYKRSDMGQRDLNKIKQDANDLIVRAKDIEKPIQGEFNNNEKIQK